MIISSLSNAAQIHQMHTNLDQEVCNTCVVFLYVDMRFRIHAVARVIFICGWLKVSNLNFSTLKWPRDINTEIVTKIVAVSAVNLSTG